MEAGSLNHWTTRKVQVPTLFKNALELFGFGKQDESCCWKPSSPSAVIPEKTQTTSHSHRTARHRGWRPGEAYLGLEHTHEVALLHVLHHQRVAALLHDDAQQLDHAAVPQPAHRPALLQEGLVVPGGGGRVRASAPGLPLLPGTAASAQEARAQAPINAKPVESSEEGQPGNRDRAGQCTQPEASLTATLARTEGNEPTAPTASERGLLDAVTHEPGLRPHPRGWSSPAVEQGLRALLPAPPVLFPAPPAPPGLPPLCPLLFSFLLAFTSSQLSPSQRLNPPESGMSVTALQGHPT